MLDVLHEERFVDLAAGEVHAVLLDEGRYLCSESTMYRLLRDRHGQVRERRRQATHPPRVKPELVAHAPNECWSWDITKLPGPPKWIYYYLYSIIDIYSSTTRRSRSAVEAASATIVDWRDHLADERKHEEGELTGDEAEKKWLEARSRRAARARPPAGRGLDTGT